MKKKERIFLCQDSRVINNRLIVVVAKACMYLRPNLGVE